MSITVRHSLSLINFYPQAKKDKGSIALSAMVPYIYIVLKVLFIAKWCTSTTSVPTHLPLMLTFFTHFCAQWHALLLSHANLWIQYQYSVIFQLVGKVPYQYIIHVVHCALCIMSHSYSITYFSRITYFIFLIFNNLKQYKIKICNIFSNIHY